MPKMKVNKKCEIELRKYFCEMIKYNTALKVLNISETFLDSRASGFHSILKAIEINRHLTNIIIAPDCCNVENGHNDVSTTSKYDQFSNAVAKSRETIPLEMEIKILFCFYVKTRLEPLLKQSFPNDLTRIIFEYAADGRGISIYNHPPSMYVVQ